MQARTLRARGQRSEVAAAGDTSGHDYCLCLHVGAGGVYTGGLLTMAAGRVSFVQRPPPAAPVSATKAPDHEPEDPH